MIASQELHIHKFKRTGTQKVRLHKIVGKGASQTGTDLILLRVCECGKSEAYDLKRTVT